MKIRERAEDGATVVAAQRQRSAAAISKMNGDAMSQCRRYAAGIFSGVHLLLGLFLALVSSVALAQPTHITAEELLSLSY